MTLWAIADLHASRPHPDTGAPMKPMDEFGLSWRNHIERLESAWAETVARDDTVVIAGDIDWALHLDEAAFTLRRLSRWNGTKLLIRGNHDFWWSSKTTSRVRRVLPPTIRLIHNDCAIADDVNVCGSKGSPVPGGIEWSPQHEKLLKRELQRLRASLDSRRSDLETIVALHFPPFYPTHGTSVYKEVLEEYGVRCCLYGHLHGDAAAAGPMGRYDGVDYRLVAGDHVGFKPVPIWDGDLMPA